MGGCRLQGDSMRPYTKPCLATLHLVGWGGGGGGGGGA